MTERKSRRDISTAAQRAYWDALADEYARITRIRTDDFHYGPQIPGERELGILPPLGPGARALELGCGEGQNSLWLAKKGLDCEALDVSEEQLAKARGLAKREGVRIAFRRASLEDFAAAAKPGGAVLVSTVHPLYNGEWIEGEREDESGADAGEAGSGLFLRDYFSPPDDVRDDAFARM